MADAAWSTLAVDLSRSGSQPLVVAGAPCFALTVFSLPFGTQLMAKDGAGNVFPLYFATQTVKFCPPITNGLTLIVPAGLAGTLLLGINAEQYGTLPANQGSAPATYLGGAYLTTAGNGAGQYSVLQLVNPANSGKMVVLRAAGIMATVAVVVSLRPIGVLQAGAPTSSIITPTSPSMPAAKAAWKSAQQINSVGGVTPAGFINGVGGSSQQARLDPLTQPLSVAPGNAIECAGGLGSNGVNLISALCWDEV